ncbi:MAG: aldo/keto reductase [Bacteroidales bacterium]|nr:aldo/keto reductase [Bacteroidales bacterium]
METIKLHNLPHKVNRIGIGTWAIGGWMWGGTDEKVSIRTLREAFDRGLNLVDTADLYGFGTSEKIVGKAIREHGNRDDLVLVTKVGVEWDEKGKVWRNSSRDYILREVEDSRKRLDTDYLDVYMIHWPDHRVDFSETAEALQKLMDEGKIRSIAVSNYSPEQMDEFRQTAPLHILEPPYNLFERDIEKEVMPYCKENDIKTLTYGALCRGLLSGRMTRDRKFEGDDIRKVDPKFHSNRFGQYLEAASKLDEFARKNYNKTVRDLAVRWVLDKGADIALWGLRKPDQLEGIDEVYGWKIEKDAMQQIDQILQETITKPVGPQFMAPPA